MAERLVLPEGWRLTSEGDSIHRLVDPSGAYVAVVIRGFDDWTARLTRQGEHKWAWSAPLMRDVVPMVLRHLGAYPRAVRVEWGVEQTTLKDGGRTVSVVESREFGERRVALGFAEPVLKRRTVTYGPWEDVPTEGLVVTHGVGEAHGTPVDDQPPAAEQRHLPDVGAEQGALDAGEGDGGAIGVGGVDRVRDVVQDEGHATTVAQAFERGE